MKKNYVLFTSLLALVFFNPKTFAQLSGSYSVPGTYTSLGAAINALNLYGVNGAVTINISSGYTETVSAGGYNLNPVVGSSSLNTITFQKSGAGANPLLIAYSGGTATPASALQDGVLRIIGNDYITIDGLSISDLNTANPATMEYGIGFFKSGPNDGCQNNVVKNCVITLKRLNNAVSSPSILPAGSRGIDVVNATYNTHTLSITVSSASGANSNNQFYANLIQNSNIGIAINGFTASSSFSLCDSYNDIGGSTAVTGNTIINYGGGGTVAATGIYSKGQYDLNISNNLINNNDGSGLNHLGPIRCVFNDVAAAANVSILNNTLTVNAGSLCLLGTVVQNNAGSSASNNTVNISNNRIVDCISAQVGNFVFNGIQNTASADYIILSGNTFTNNSIVTSVSNMNLINNSGAANVSIDISNNILNGVVNNFNYSGVYDVILNSSGTPSTNVSINNNSFYNIDAGGTSGTIEFIAVTGTNSALQLNNNTWNNISCYFAGTITLMENLSVSKNILSVSNNSIITGFTRNNTARNFTGYTGNYSTTSPCSITCSNNNFSNITCSVSGGGDFYGFNFNDGNSPNPYKQVFNNVLSNITYSSTGNFNGIVVNGLGTGPGNLPSSVHHNTVTNANTRWVTAGIAVYGGDIGEVKANVYSNLVSNINAIGQYAGLSGMVLSSNGAGFNFYKNKIVDCVSTTTLYVFGIQADGKELNIFNNLVGNISAPYGLIGPISLFGIYAANLENGHLNNNSVYLSGSGYGSCALLAGSYYNSPLEIKNNLLVNLYTTAGTGSAIALNISAGFTPNVTSANNLLYTGAFGAARIPLMLGTTAYYNTLAAAKLANPSLEINSVTENVVFSSTLGATSNYLAVNSLSPTLVESGGTPVSGITDDFNGNPRDPGFPDIGAHEGNYIPVIAADINPPNFGAGAFINGPCNISNRTFTVNLSDMSGIAGGTLSPRMYYKVNAGSYTSVPGVLSSGTATNGLWTFNMNYAATYYDIISYYLVAQDASANANMSTLPPMSNAGSSVNTITLTPATNSFLINYDLNGTYTVGAGGTFSTLTSAAKAYNSSCLNGPVTFVLTNTLYLAGEIYPVTFINHPSASSTNSLLVIPGSGKAVTVMGTLGNDSALIRFYDARYITWDGLNIGGSSITLMNTNGGNYSTCSNIWLRNTNYGWAPGNKYLTFRNMNFSSTATNSLSCGIFATGYNYYNQGIRDSYITIEKNNFTALGIGISATGYSISTPFYFDNWTITSNQFGPLSSSTLNLGSGISLANCVNVSVNSNTFSNLYNSNNYNAPYAINLGNGVHNCTLSANYIRSVKTQSYNTVGININTQVAASNILLQNNMISEIGLTQLTQNANIYGLYLVSTGGVKLYNNTFALTQGAAFASYNYYIDAYAAYIDNCFNLDLRNNIFYNNIENVLHTSSDSYGLYSVPTTSAYTNIDYNNYYAPGYHGYPGYISGNRTTLAAIKAGFGQNLSSQNLPVVFTSSTDVHLDQSALSNYALQDLGSTLPGLITDIDGQVRNPLTPDMGADEWNSTATCTTAAGGTISPASYTICGDQPLSIQTSSASGGINATMQWLVSNSPTGTYTNVSGGAGASSTSYSSSLLPGGTYYYRFDAGCPTLSLTSSSNIASVTVVAPPVLSVSVSQSVVCAGTSVTLSASGASSYSWNTGSTSSSIIVTPSVSTTYSVYYGSAPCAFSMSPAQIIYAQASPTLNIASTATSICAGSQVTLTASGAITYTWDNGSNSTSITVSPTVTSTYTLNGSNSIACNASLSRSIVVNALPSLSVTGSSTLCSGQTTTLLASGASSYTWSTGTVASSIIVSPATNTVYSITGRNSASCTANSSYSITVIPGFTLSVSGPTAVCSGQSASLTASGASNYTWSTGSFTNLSVVSPTSNASYTVTGEAGGCSLSVTRSMSVLATPSISINGYTLACAGQSGNLVASGASSYTWNTGVNSPTLVITPTVSTSYTVSGDNGACVAQRSISVNTTTVPVLSVSASAASVCPSSAVTLTASGASTYTWSNASIGITTTVYPNGPSTYTVSGSNGSACIGNQTISISNFTTPLISVSPSSASTCVNSAVSFTASGASTYTWNGAFTGSTVSLNPPGSLIYQVIGTSAQACTNTAFFSVTAYSLPVIIISPSSASICTGSTASFTANGAATYTWNGSIVSQAISFLPFSNTVYSVSGTNAQGCVAGNTVGVTLQSLPVLTVSSSSGIVCPGTAINFSVSGATTYSWSGLGSGNVISVSPPAPAIYSVTGTSAFGCQSTATLGINTYSVPVISVSPASPTVCAFSPISFTAFGASTYTWNGNLTGANVSLTPPSNIIYQVIGSSAQSCTNSAYISVTANPIPTLSLNPPSASICQGSSAGFTVSGASTYTWNGAIQSSVVNFLPFSTTTYSVGGTNANGCSSNTTVLVTVNPIPTLSLSPLSTTVCAFTNISFTASGASSYTWSNGALGSILNAAPSTSTVFTVAGTSTANCSALPLTATVSVLPIPLLSINASTLTMCQGNQATLSVSGALSYTWTQGLSSLSNATLVVVSPTTSTLYQISGTGINGCINSGTNAAAVNLTVSPLPQISIAGSTAVCMGNTVVLSANALGVSSYSWSNGSTNSSISLTPLVNSSYTLVGLSAQGCSNSASINLLVNSLPTVSISGPTLNCSGKSSTLTANGASTYVWNTSSTGTSISVSPNTTSTYTVVGTDANGCQNTSAKTLSVAPSPTVTALASSTVLCSGSPLTLQGQGAGSYSWSAGVLDNTSFPATQSTTYSVTGFDANGCEGSATIMISVKASPTLVVSSSFPMLCEGDSAILSVNGAFHYLWETNDTLSSIQVKPLVSTSYSVSGTGTNGCSNSVSFTQSVTICTGLTNVMALQQGISIYPNPGNGEFYVLLGEVNQNTWMEVYDLLGQVILKKKLDDKITKHNLGAISKGLYTIRITENGAASYHINLIKD